MNTDESIDRSAVAGAAAVTLTFGYSAAEDRIVGVCAQGDVSGTVLLTRRLVRQIIARLAQLLNQSSPVASRAPASMRAEVVQIEHQSAVAQLSCGSGPAALKSLGDAAARSPGMLVTRVDLTPQGNGFLLVFGAADGRNASLRLQWQDLHRLVAALNLQARNAQWDFAEAAPWLAQPQASSPAAA